MLLNALIPRPKLRAFAAKVWHSNGRQARVNSTALPPLSVCRSCAGSVVAKAMHYKEEAYAMGFVKQDLSTVQAMETAFSMQLEFINVINNLIVYDKDHSETPEKTKYLQAFCDTQERALDEALRLLDKHKDALLADEASRKEQEEQKRKAEQTRIKAENKKKEKTKAIAQDLKKAKEDADSLFAEWEGSDTDEEIC